MTKTQTCLLAMLLLLTADELRSRDATPTAAAPWRITERFAHSQTWETTESFLDPVSGNVIPQKRRFVELASGLNFWDDQARAFRPTREQFQITADGFATATEGPHKLIVENNINSDTALDCLTSDGVPLRSGQRGQLRFHHRA